MKEIRTDNAPEAVGAYSQGKICDGIIYTSGQIGLLPGQNKIDHNSFESEVRQSVENVLAVVRAGGGNAKTLIKSTIFMVDLDHYSTVNRIYHDQFSSNLPARSVIQVKGLPKSARLEIEAMAHVQASE